MMKLFINGKEEQASVDLTVIQLLKEKNVEMPDMVTVELNGKILKREQFETIKVKENDKVEFLYFMGGGS